MATTKQYLTKGGVDRNEKTDRAEYLSKDGTDVNETTAAVVGPDVGYFRLAR